MTPRIRGLCAGAALSAALLGAPAGAGAAACPGGESGRYVCGVDDPEDLLRVPGTRYVLTSGVGDVDSQRGGVYAVDVATHEAREVMPGFGGPARPRFENCPGPPDADLFSAHGLALTGSRAVPGRRTTGDLYVVNHGGRESIEVFRLKVAGSRVELDWAGCVLLPGGLVANSVAPLPAGGMVATVPLLSQSELPNAGLGQPTGDVLRWSPQEDWEPVPGASASFPNGVLASRDGERLFLAGYTEQAVLSLPLDGSEPAERVSVPFNPDNLRWSPTGEILVAGQDEEPAVVQLTCIQTDRETCPIATGVAELDPVSLEATPLYAHPGDETFGMGTASIFVGDELWIGSARARRVLRVPLSELAAPARAETPTGLPALRLKRRCPDSERTRASVTGDVARVQQVVFRVGGRRVLDPRAPFARGMTGDGALRAVATLRHGELTRVALRARRCRR